MLSGKVCRQDVRKALILFFFFLAPTQWLEYKYSRVLLLASAAETSVDLLVELEDCLKMARDLGALGNPAWRDSALSV